MSDAGNATKSTRRTYLFPAVALVLAVVVFVSIYTGLFSARSAGSSSTLESLSVCSTAQGDGAVVACARTVIDRLLETHTTAELMSMTATGTYPTVFRGCHSLGHMIGIETYKKNGSLEKALSQCTQDCNHACVHGALSSAIQDEFKETYPEEDIAHSGAAEIESIAKKYCDRSFALCHGVGHILLIATNDFEKAVESCDTISDDLPEERCLGGVFMQGAGGLRAFQIGSSSEEIARPKNDYRFPCDKIQEKFSHGCLQFLPEYENVLFEAQGVTDPAKKLGLAVQTCETFAGFKHRSCFEGIGRYMGEKNIFPAYTADKIATCEQFTDREDAESCVLGKVSLLTQVGNDASAIAYCATLQKSNTQNLCYQAFFQYRKVTSAADGIKACGAATQAETCVAQVDTYLAVKNSLPNYYYGLTEE